MAPHIHILGICGTFMGGVALLAREQGFRVSGSDANVYPPMSDQLAAAGIDLMEGYDPAHLDPAPDLVVVGNAMTRGNPAVEYLLNRGIPYISGPQWLGETLLAGRWVLAVAGTHGKTTTSSMLAWILEYAGMAPGFLIGGVPANFGLSARSGKSDFFVVEADEYDTAFFDKRSKFVHYRPRTLVAANVEFDHADIFDDLAAIERQFHHLFRCVPGEGLIVRGPGAALDRIAAQGVWTPLQLAGQGDGDWSWQPLQQDCSRFEVLGPDGNGIEIDWSLLGAHNASNGVMAMAAARHVGVAPVVAAEALASFAGVKRRLELRGSPADIRVYDDFAHHPTAIQTTLTGVRAREGDGRVIALIEPRSNTMRGSSHVARLNEATAAADAVFWYAPAALDWSLDAVVDGASNIASWYHDSEALLDAVDDYLRAGDSVILMSNGSFDGLHQRLIARLERRATSGE